MTEKAYRFSLDVPDGVVRSQHDMGVDLSIAFLVMAFEAQVSDVDVGSSPEELPGRRVKIVLFRVGMYLMTGKAPDLSVKERKGLHGAFCIFFSRDHVDGMMVALIPVAVETDR
jgi:hypothetical protein